ncbi:MAG TPA: hypothetical protein VGM92_15140, partial [Candidatus Kapabacteria bacterium]
MNRERNIVRSGIRQIFLLAFWALLAMPSSSHAQRIVTLDECLQIAHTQSPGLFEARRKYDIARLSAEAQSRSLYTQIDLTLTAPLYTDNTVPTYNPQTGATELLPLNITQFGPGLTITQPIEWTGGTLSVTGNVYRQSQIPGFGSQTNDYVELSTIAINQPLFKANELALTSEEAGMELEDARAAYVTEWAALNYSIENLFYTLYENEEQFQIQRDVVTTSEANYVLA